MTKRIILLTTLLLTFICGYSQQPPNGLSMGKGKIGGGLIDRDVEYEPVINCQFQKSGRVVMRVCINSDGKVISSDYTQRGSTTTDSDLKRIAEQAVYKFKFSPGDLEKQCGTITIDFIVENQRNDLGVEFDESFEDYDEDGDYVFGEKDLQQENNHCYTNILNGISAGNNEAEKYRQTAVTKANKGDYIEALEMIIKAQKIASSDFVIFAVKGSIKSCLEDYRGAIKDFDKSIKLKPKYEELYLLRGEAYLNLGNFERAIIDFNKAIELNAKYAEAYANRGLSKLQKHEIQRLKVMLGGGYDNKIESHLKEILDDACLDLSRAGELGYYEAYDIIRKHCK